MIGENEDSKMGAGESGENEGGHWCEVCFEKDETEGAEKRGAHRFLRCVKCQVQVHKRCYGASKVAEDGESFTCEVCAANNSKAKVRCILIGSLASFAVVLKAA